MLRQFSTEPKTIAKELNKSKANLDQKADVIGIARKPTIPCPKTHPDQKAPCHPNYC